VFAGEQRNERLELGIWSHDGRHTYLAKSIAFIHFSTPGTPPTVPPFKLGTQTIAQTIEFQDDPDAFNSDATIEFADNDLEPNGINKLFAVNLLNPLNSLDSHSCTPVLVQFSSLFAV
jgi:hypothetical protein